MMTLPDGMDASDLLPHAAEEGVLFAPGRLFSAEGRCASQLRLSFGNVDEEKIVEGVARLARSARREMDGGRRRDSEREPVAAPPLV